MRIEITHTVKGANYAPMMQAYKEALAVDREKNENFKEPRVLVNVFGELNRVRIEMELEQTDGIFQGWLNNGCPSLIEGIHSSGHEKAHAYSEKMEVAWLQDVNVSAAGECGHSDGLDLADRMK